MAVGESARRIAADAVNLGVTKRFAIFRRVKSRYFRSCCAACEPACRQVKAVPVVSHVQSEVYVWLDVENYNRKTWHAALAE